MCWICILQFYYYSRAHINPDSNTDKQYNIITAQYTVRSAAECFLLSSIAKTLVNQVENRLHKAD